LTKPATRLARFVSTPTILLWDGDEIAHVLERERIGEFLEYKYRECVETGVPDFDIRGVLP
jgi:hypothetical protein